jgi:hypothetical protein
MCYPAECPRCHKTTWAGCGEHVDQVMRNVPTTQQCTCNPQRGPRRFARARGGASAERVVPGGDRAAQAHQGDR